jgi:hypothetical protein
MENFEMMIVLSLAYFLAVAWLTMPKTKVTQHLMDETKIPKKRGRKHYIHPNQLSLDFENAQRKELKAKTIRELKKLASQAKIKRYSYLTKAQLIQALETI